MNPALGLVLVAVGLGAAGYFGYRGARAYADYRAVKAGSSLDVLGLFTSETKGPEADALRQTALDGAIAATGLGLALYGASKIGGSDG